MQLKIYGEQAKEIKEGQTFTAKITDVEGRTVVVLESNFDCGCERTGSFHTYPSGATKCAGCIHDEEED